jgi:hypothetical protein
LYSSIVLEDLDNSFEDLDNSSVNFSSLEKEKADREIKDANPKDLAVKTPSLQVTKASNVKQSLLEVFKNVGDSGLIQA